MTERKHKTMSEGRVMLLATVPPIAITIVLYILSYFYKPGTGSDLSVMESFSNILSTLTTLYLTTVLVLITHRYMRSTEEQTNLLREKHEEETNKGKAAIDAAIQNGWNRGGL